LSAKERDDRCGDPETLVERARAGDRFALRQIYEANKLPVLRVVSRMVDIPADRDEVVQDVFYQVFRSIGRYDGRSKLSTWIYRVAINVSLQHIRKKKSRIQLTISSEMTDHLEARGDIRSEATPEDAAQRAEREVAMERALSRLSPKKRAAIVLHDFEGVPAKEIAAIVRAPLRTVRTRLFYARRELFQLLSEEPAFAGLLEDGDS